jgi:8-amino-7-oxononanoate synthase
MNERLSRYSSMLEELDGRGRRRGLADAHGVDFSSNDYLALAGSAELACAAAGAIARGVPVGATGSRLLRGHHDEHAMLEAEAAAFFGSERALFFGSGYAANQALFSTLPQTGDLVVYDALSHASTREGLKAGRAEARPFRHNDPDAADAAIGDWRAAGGRGTPWIAAESVYSMEGDKAPTSALLAVAERRDGFIVMDEAHATGVWGEGGRGLAAASHRLDRMIAVHTCGKALGVSGALVTGADVLIDFLVNRARPFVFGTAPSPLTAALVRAALQIVDREPERRQRVRALVERAGTRLLQLGVEPTGTQIVPILIGADEAASAAARRLQTAGFDCRAIRPPTVREGTARLRISLTLNASLEEVDALFDALEVGRAAA